MGRVLIFLIRLYQSFISPHIGHCCRFEPSCSSYSIDAIMEHGVLKGVWLSMKRISKCHPFGKYGYDPVPKGVNHK